MSGPRPPLVLVGPTASGKSAVALALARRRRAVPGAAPVELVGCDSMQVYGGMEVGTAQPTAAELGDVPHHLLGFVDPGQDFHLARFRALVGDVLADVAARGAEAVLVGGTGLYVRAVVDDLRPPGRYPEAVAALEPLGTEELARRLADLDPVAARRVPPGNRRRLLRALEVTIGSGRPFSAAGPGLDSYPPTPFTLVGLSVPREALDGRIRRRVHRQLDDGWAQEAERLRDRAGGRSRTAAAALGYAELEAHLRGDLTLPEAVDAIVRRTRRLAVRQERWFRRDPRLRWVAAPGGDRTPDGVAEEVDRCWDEGAEPAAAPGGAAATVATHPVAGPPAARPPDADHPRDASCSD